MAKTEPDEDRVFDVAKPGKSAPDSSARPVIVGHRTILKDPTLKAVEDPEFPKEEKPSETTTAPELKPPSAEKVVIPITEKPAKDKKKKAEDPPNEDVEESEPRARDSVTDEKEESTKPASEEAVQDDPEAKDEKKEASDGDDKKATKEPEAAPAENDEEVPVEATANQKETDKKKQEEIARQAALEKVVVDKTYFVPIGEVKRKRSNRRALLVLLIVIIIAVAMADLLIDSGMIKTNVKAPVHIFKTNITQ